MLQTITIDYVVSILTKLICICIYGMYIYQLPHVFRVLVFVIITASNFAYMAQFLCLGY